MLPSPERSLTHPGLNQDQPHFQKCPTLPEGISFDLSLAPRPPGGTPVRSRPCAGASGREARSLQTTARGLPEGGSGRSKRWRWARWRVGGTKKSVPQGLRQGGRSSPEHLAGPVGGGGARSRPLPRAWTRGRGSRTSSCLQPLGPHLGLTSAKCSHSVDPTRREHGVSVYYPNWENLKETSFRAVCCLTSRFPGR
jgi:hypothetical protein